MSRIGRLVNLMRNFTLVFIFLSAIIPGLAQKDNQYILAISNATAATTSGILRNVGQVQHTIAASVVATGGCAAAVASANRILPVVVQGSYNNSQWFNIGPAGITLSTAASPYTGIGFASGAYPYLRVNYYTTVNAGCSVTINYTGAISGFQNLIPSATFVQVNNTGSTVIAAATLLGAQPNAKIVVYGLLAYGRVTATTLTIFTTSTATACSAYDGSGDTWFFQYQIDVALGTTLQLPNAGNPIFIGGTGLPLCFAVTGGGTLGFSLVARYE